MNLIVNKNLIPCESFIDKAVSFHPNSHVKKFKRPEINPILYHYVSDVGTVEYLEKYKDF